MATAYMIWQATFLSGVRIGSLSPTYRVLRGGSWGNTVGALRVANRNGVNPSGTSINYGFRCVSGFPAAQQ